MSKQTGGPAFPSDRVSATGMTLRDYFAAQAMQGILANRVYAGWDWNTVSEESYCLADAMIAERNE